MKHLKNNLEIEGPHPELLHRVNPILIRMILFLLGIGLLGCSDFVEVATANNRMMSETVVNDASAVESALANIYYKMREEGMISGFYGFTGAMGCYGDELDYYGFDIDLSQLYNHNQIASNGLLSG